MICLSNPRRAIHDALLFQQRSAGDPYQRGSKCTGESWRDIERTQAGFILRELDKLDATMAGDWVRVAYQQTNITEPADRLKLHLFDQLVTEPISGGRKVIRFLNLATAAQKEMAQRVLNGGRRFFKQAELARLIGVQPANFGRDGWADHWEKALTVLGELDDEAVALVAPVCAWLQDRAA